MDTSPGPGCDKGSDADSDTEDGAGFVAYGLSSEQREALVAAMTAALPKAGADYGAAIRALMATAEEPDPFELMGALTFYLGSAVAGTNPEFNRPLGIFQHHLEFAQAVLFRAGSSHASSAPPSTYIEEFASALRACNAAWVLLQIQKLDRATTDEERKRQALLFQLRVHASTNRGWGYSSRMDRMLDHLLEPLSYLRGDLGFAPVELPALWHAMGELANERLQNHREAVWEAFDWPVDDQWPKRVAERFGAPSDPEPESLIVAAQQADEVRQLQIVSRADRRLHEIYRFTLDDLVRIWPGEVAPEIVRSIVSLWAIAPGDEAKVSLDRLPVENPVVARPFVSNGDDVWYLFCGWLPLHNPFELIERTLDGHDGAIAAYRDRRAEFLEQRVSELLSAGLPGATVERSLLSTDPADGREYENDVVAMISSFAVVAEAKAGGVHPDARNRPRVLRDRIEELVVKPSEQALRLATRLESAVGEIQFRRRSDDSVLIVNASEIRRTLTIGVTLEPIADLLPRLAEIEGAGFTATAADALSYSINILDLEVVIDVLEHPSEVLHYLGRRSEIERRMFLGGDEVDLLGLYLETGFNLGEHEFGGEYRLQVTGMSDPIDVWQYRLEAGMDAEKPRVKRTAWWERVLTRAEQRKTPRWAEIGVTMCNVAPPDQQEFEDAMHELRRAVVAGEREPTDLVAFWNGPPQRRDLFVGVIVTSTDPDERKQQYRSAIGDAIAEDDSHRAILLAWTPAPIEYPYFALAAYDADQA